MNSRHACMAACDSQALLDHAPDGVFVADVRGRCCYVNRAGCGLLGMDASQVVQTTLFDLIPAADIPRMQAALRSMREGHTHVDEWTLRHQDGHDVGVEISATILPNGQWLSFVREVRHRGRHERHVLTSEPSLWGLFELLPVGLRIADTAGVVLRANAAARRLWGGTRDVGLQEEGCGKGWWADTGQPVAVEDWPLARALRTGQTAVGKVMRVQPPGGGCRTIIASAVPMIGAEGRIIGAACISEDLTDLHDLDARLRDSEALFRTALELLPVGLYVADRVGHIVYGNSAGKDIWQGLRHVGPDEYGEYKAWWAESGEPVSAEDWALARALRTGETSQNELIRIQCFDGTLKTVVNWAAPIRGAGGDVTGAVAINQDVTALLRTQDGLRSAIREREHILAVVAHDLRNPLHRIFLAATLLQAKSVDSPCAEECIAAADSILSVTRRMAGIVDDLLAISVEPFGGAMLHVGVVKADDLLSLAAREQGGALAEAGLELEVRHGAGGTVIRADVARVMRVFANLLDNAAKFTERGGRVVLRSEAAAGAVTFSIANSGAPLADAEREKLFVPFWQASGDDTRGAGLGLSICRTIVEAHGGALWTERSPGMRLKVLFLLPRTQQIPSTDPGSRRG